jgi:hypothetical protein
LTFIPLSIKLFRQIGLSWTAFFVSLWPILASAAVMGLALAGIRLQITAYDWNVKTKLIVEVAAGVAVYGLSFLVFFREKLVRYIRFLKGLRGGGGIEAA